jgi:hypothetical protein
VAFVPSVLMMNRETCTLAEFIPWMKRQMLATRLYHPAWPSVFWQGIVTLLALILAVLVLIVALARGDAAAVTWAGAGLLAYEGSMLLLLALGEAAARVVARDRGEPTDWITPATALRIALALPMTQLVYGATLPSVARLRSVSWRGIDYRIDGPYTVRMLEYRPYRPASEVADAPASL